MDRVPQVAIVIDIYNAGAYEWTLKSVLELSRKNGIGYGLQIIDVEKGIN